MSEIPSAAAAKLQSPGDEITPYPLLQPPASLSTCWGSGAYNARA